MAEARKEFERIRDRLLHPYGDLWSPFMYPASKLVKLHK